MALIKAHTDLNLDNAVTTSMDTAVDDYSVDRETTDAAQTNEYKWVNSDWSKQYGYYKNIPELQKAINVLASWSVSKGYESDARTKVILEHITGWGEDTFESLIWNMLVTKKIGGDSFAEVIRDEKTGILINLKPLDPSTIGIVTNKKGKIIRYEQLSKVGKKTMVDHKFEPKQILHLCNERIADNIHGTSVIDACEWTILARNEVMADWKRVLHRNVVPFRILEVDTEDATKLAKVKADYQEVINKGEVAVVPKGNIEVKDSTANLQDPLSWIRYLEDFFYHTVGVPKVMLGGSSDFTESSAKISFLTFSQTYEKEQKELEKDIWNQLFLRITFVKPASLQHEMLSDTQKDGKMQQTGFQPNDVPTQEGVENGNEIPA